MTDAEKLLWSKIKGKQVHNLQFYRQKILGEYIVDFYCPKVNLVIEIDGSQHYTIEGALKDKIRDEFLKNNSLNILRFGNHDVLNNIEGILIKIEEFIKNA